MTYQNFIDKTIDALTPMLPAEADIYTEKICKNNGFYPQALIISTPENNIFPTIYLDEYYERANHGDSLERIFEEIYNVYESHKIDEPVDTSFLSDFEKVRDKLALRLVNKKLNKELLATVPHEDFLDMAVIPSLVFDCVEAVYAGTIVHNSHLKTWDISKKDLLNEARKNVSLMMPGQITSLPDFLNEIAGEIVISPDEISKSMHILTNQGRSHGAICMTYTDVIAGFADSVGADVFILPSSIHEVMLVADDGHTGLNEYSQLVREVNETQVAKTEILNDHAYLFKRDSGEFVY